MACREHFKQTWWHQSTWALHTSPTYADIMRTPDSPTPFSGLNIHTYVANTIWTLGHVVDGFCMFMAAVTYRRSGIISNCSLSVSWGFPLHPVHMYIPAYTQQKHGNMYKCTPCVTWYQWMLQSVKVLLVSLDCSVLHNLHLHMYAGLK